MIDEGNSQKAEEQRKTDSQKLDVPINEFYQLVQNEYNCERDRKQSIETRSGIILTVSMAFFAFVIEKVDLKFIFAKLNEPLTGFLFIEILAGLLTYISYFLSVLFSIWSLKSKIYAFYNVSNITTATLLSPRIPTFGQIILDYVDIIKTNREVNNKKVKNFNWSILCLVICIICLCIYINLK